METTQRESQSMLAVYVGLVANIILAFLKTTIGILGHSPALLADGINSTSDVAAYVVVGAFMRQAGKPPDHEHPYGHRQLESIAALVVGSFVITVAIAIFFFFFSAIYELWLGDSDFTGASLLALGVAFLSVVIKLGLTIFTRRIGRETNNVAIMALAYDHRNDLFSSLAATLGIIIGRMGYLWVDPLAGALVALVVLRTGLEIIRDSSYDLMDTVPAKTLAKQITNQTQAVPGVKQIEEIHTHRFGPYLVVNVTIGIDGNISVAKGDAIASQVERALYQDIELLRRVYVHYHPVQAKVEEPNLILEPESEGQ